MRWQKNISQMKEQDETPEEQLNGDRQLSKKWIQNIGSEDDPRPWKKNGGKDQEDTRNI